MATSNKPFRSFGADAMGNLISIGVQIATATGTDDKVEFNIGQASPEHPFKLKRLNIWNESRAWHTVEVFSFNDGLCPLLLGTLLPYAEGTTDGAFRFVGDIPFTGKLTVYFYGATAGDVLKASGVVEI